MECILQTNKIQSFFFFSSFQSPIWTELISLHRFSLKMSEQMRVKSFGINAYFQMLNVQAENGLSFFPSLILMCLW